MNATSVVPARLFVLILGALLLAFGGPETLLMAAPALVLLGLVATGRYIGAEKLARLRSSTAGPPRRAVHVAPSRPPLAVPLPRVLRESAHGLRGPPLKTTFA